MARQRGAPLHWARSTYTLSMAPLAHALTKLGNIPGIGITDGRVHNVLED